MLLSECQTLRATAIIIVDPVSSPYLRYRRYEKITYIRCKMYLIVNHLLRTLKYSLFDVMLFSSRTAIAVAAHSFILRAAFNS